VALHGLPPTEHVTAACWLPLPDLAALLQPGAAAAAAPCDHAAGLHAAVLHFSLPESPLLLILSLHSLHTALSPQPPHSLRTKNSR
jgi:hypothetical protein